MNSILHDDRPEDLGHRSQPISPPPLPSSTHPPACHHSEVFAGMTRNTGAVILRASGRIHRDTSER